MRGTLSHPNRSLPDAKAGRRAREIFVAAALCGSLLGCNEVVTHQAESDAEVAQSELSEPDFSWPEDPSHPVLEIRVENPKASGVIRVELMPELAPATVVQVIDLANEGHYDGTTFHRVIPGFMIQGGDPNSRDRDPTNDGMGRSAVTLHDEFGAAPFERGVVGMANLGRPNSTSSQFFIMHSDNDSLDGRYTAIGRVLEGMDFVDRITQVPIDLSGRWGPRDRPIANVVMTRVRTIGQVAAIRAARERELAAASEGSDSEAKKSAGDQIARSDSPPASLATGDDWERLEANGR